MHSATAIHRATAIYGAPASASWFALWWPALVLALVALITLAALGWYLRRQSHAERDNVDSNFEHTANWGRAEEDWTDGN